jgi:amino acid transporter
MQKRFGTLPVFLTSVSSILGAVLFLRLGWATGELGLWGVLSIIVLGHLITVPTALAISELATNTRVEGGGEYFIISRSFGLKVGSTVGMALFLSQAISVAFYTIAFAEAFGPFYDWFEGRFGWELPHQAVSVPALLLMAWLILRRGTGSGMRLLYVVCGLLALSLVMFFLGGKTEGATGDAYGFFNGDNFFVVFAVCFPAFTGMTAGVGLSGDLRNPGRSIPIGTMLGTVTGLVAYVLVVWKLAASATRVELIGEQLIMSRIALLGWIVVPLGLMAAAGSSALGMMLVAPRTLQAIAGDRVFPFRRVNITFARGRGERKEPYNASLATFAIALAFVVMGDVNSVAQVISMFFLVSYGSLCLSSFLNHFGSPPSYRPRFHSRWYVSLAGFLLSVWVMFMINALYTVAAYTVLVLLYLYIERSNRDKKGIVNIFKGALFQLNRTLQVYMQKQRTELEHEEWRPAVLCISQHSFDRPKVFDLMRWICRKHGFGTYFHLIDGYFGRETHAESEDILRRLVAAQREAGSALYIDTMVSPSYTSAIAQAIQTPSISGMENNMALFEYDKRHPHELGRILDNVSLVRAGGFDVGIYAISQYEVRPEGGIHVWVSDIDAANTNFMILLGYIILSHPEWRQSEISIFITSLGGDVGAMRAELRRRIAAGRLPITMQNIEIVIAHPGQRLGAVVESRSRRAGLVVFGFSEELVRGGWEAFFGEFETLGDVLFVNAAKAKEI